MTTKVELKKQIADHERMIIVCSGQMWTTDSRTARSQLYGKIAYHSRQIQKLKEELNVLKHDTEAITDDAPFRKHDVGGSTANEEITSLGNDPGAAASETATVGGNKQTKEVCQCSYPELRTKHSNYCWRCHKYTS